MKNRNNLFIIVLGLIVFSLAVSCATNGTPQNGTSNTVSLDQVLQLAVANIDEKLGLTQVFGEELGTQNLNKKPILAVINFSSQSYSLSEYIVDKLVMGLTNSVSITLVSRQHLDAIRKEMDFQFSGEVADDQIRAIGKKYGAQYVVTGGIKDIGRYYNVQVIALDVETGEGKAATDENINRNDEVVKFFIEKDKAEEKRIADAKAAEEKKAADAKAAEAQRIANAKAAEEKRIADAKAAEELKRKQDMYKLGSRGPGGGFVFDISGNTFKEYVELTDPNDGWDTETYDVARSSASNYRGGGYNNWHLANLSELKILYANFKNRFWSHSLYWFSASRGYWSFCFGDGEYERVNKDDSLNVIAVREF
jgi:TolB-like protein